MSEKLDLYAEPTDETFESWEDLANRWQTEAQNWKTLAVARLEMIHRMHIVLLVAFFCSGTLLLFCFFLFYVVAVY